MGGVIVMAVTSTSAPCGCALSPTSLNLSSSRQD